MPSLLFMISILLLEGLNFLNPFIIDESLTFKSFAILTATRAFNKLWFPGSLTLISVVILFSRLFLPKVIIFTPFGMAFFMYLKYLSSSGRIAVLPGFKKEKISDFVFAISFLFLKYFKCASPIFVITAIVGAVIAASSFISPFFASPFL